MLIEIEEHKDVRHAGKYPINMRMCSWVQSTVCAIHLCDCEYEYEYEWECECVSVSALLIR